MHWLSENSGVIQAIASVGSLVVTSILAYLTYRYVKLTRAIANTALQQIHYLSESSRVAKQQSAHALKALAFNLRDNLGRSLSIPPVHKQLRAFDSLNERVITDLESFARQVDIQAIPLAVEAAASLRVISGIIQKAKSTHKNMGWEPEEQETKNWRAAIETSHRNLQALESMCEQVTET